MSHKIMIAQYIREDSSKRYSKDAVKNFIIYSRS